MPYIEFDGKLDDEIPAAKGYVPFDGELDPVEEKAPQAARPLRTRGGVSSESRPYVAGMEPAGGAQAALKVDNQIEANQRGPLSALDKRTSIPVPSTYTNAEMQNLAALEVSPWKAEDDRKAAARAASIPTLKATPIAVSAGMDINKGLGNSGGASAVKGSLQGLAGLGKVVPGLVAGAADAVGADGVSDFALGAAQQSSAFDDAVAPKGTYIDKAIGGIFNSVVQSLPMMAFGLGGATEIVGGKAVADLAAKKAMDASMRALWNQTAGQEYADARNAGFEPLESAARAAIFSQAEVWGEKFGFKEQMAVLKATFGKVPTGQLSKVLSTEIAKQTTGEELTTALEFLADKHGPAAMNPQATLQDYLQQAADTAVQTVGQTLLMGAPAGAVRGARGLVNAAQTPEQRRDADLARAFDEQGFAPPVVEDINPNLARAKTPVVNMTPADSLSAQAGLTPIVVPIPPQVSTDGAETQQPVQKTGNPSDASAYQVAGGALDGVLAAGEQNRVDHAARMAAAGSPLAASQPEVGATVAPAPVQPAGKPDTAWYGRGGAGYKTIADATQALAGKSAKEPAFDWKVEEHEPGKFRLAGYAKESASGNQQGTGPALAGTQGQTAVDSGPGQVPAGTGGTAVATDGTSPVGQGAAALAQGPGTARPVGERAPRGWGAVDGGSDSSGTSATGGLSDGARSDVPGGAPLGDPDPHVDRILRSIEQSRLKRGEEVQLERIEPSAEDGTDVPQKLAKVFGMPIILARTQSGRQTFSAVHSGGAVVLMTNANDAGVALATHEILHGMPEDIKSNLIAAIRPMMKRDAFTSDFSYAPDKVDEEITARLAQQHAKTPEFWTEIRKHMGEGNFAKLAEHILAKLDELVGRFTGNDLTRYATDVKAVREALAKAYAETAKRVGDTTAERSSALESAQSEVASSEEQAPDFAEERGRAEKHGEHNVRVFKDGSIRVEGDGAAIRALMPENIKGRITSAGMEFTNADAPRVRAALDGQNLAYGRAGEVTDKLPMKDGKYLGAPKKYDKPGNISLLRKSLMKLTMEGEAGRLWYENSGKAILRMVGGDVKEARKFLALCAIYSPQAKVDANSTFALRAWAQYKAVQPISVKTKVMDDKATEALNNVDTFWSGEKTGNFVTNLLRVVDPTLKQGATIDMWMMRAAEYENDVPTKTQYAFMENETNRIAAELGWEPQQVQAAIWVAMKARMENSGVKKATEANSFKKGWIRYAEKVNPETGKTSKVRVVIDDQKHRDNWLEHAFKHDPSTDDTKAAKYDFENGVQAHIGQVSWEARPSRSVPHMQGVNDASHEVQVEYQQAIHKALHDDVTGVDLLAQHLGLLVDGEDLLAPGVWQAEVTAGMQKPVAMAPVAGGKRLVDTTTGSQISEEAAAEIDSNWKKNDRFRDLPRVDDGQSSTLNVYTSVLGLGLKQDGVGWHRPFYTAAKMDANGREFRIGRPLTVDETKAVYDAVEKKMLADGKPKWQDEFALINSPVGIRTITFGAISNEDIQSKAFERVVGDALPDSIAVSFASHGDMPSNNWKETPDGQGYRSRISKEGRSDVLGWAATVLAPRIQAVNEDFAKRYGWGDPGVVSFSDDVAVAKPAGGSSTGSDESSGRGSRVRGAIHYSPQEGLSVLSGRAFGSGIRGAEQARLAEATDERIKRRVYFYLPTAPGTVPAPEAGLGGHVYSADLGNLYDAHNHPFIKGATPNALESAILDAGYRGYVNREQGTAVVLNSDVPVKYVGPAGEQQKVGRATERIAPKNVTRQEGEELVRRIVGDEMVGVIKARPTLTKVAPSFKLQYGEARVHVQEFASANAALHEAGSSVQFSDDPVKTVKAYKLFRTDPSQPGKLFSLFIGKTVPYEVGKWAPAENLPTKGYAPRPGLHAGLNPSAPHLRTKDNKISPNRLWAEISMPDDIDWQTAADANKTGKKTRGDIKDQIPVGGHYNFNTSKRGSDGKQNPAWAWMIGGSMRIDRVLSNDEVRSILEAAGMGSEADAETSTTPGIHDPYFSDDKYTNFSDDVNPIGFFSELARRVQGGPGKAMPDQWKAYINGLTTKGVKPEEIQWSGVNDWLSLQTGKVDKSAVTDFLHANGVRVTETVLGDGSLSGEEAIEFGELMDLERRMDEGEEGVMDDSDIARLEELRAKEEDNDEPTRTKYGEYTLPGGKNYREVLLTLPLAKGQETRSQLMARVQAMSASELEAELRTQGLLRGDLADTYSKGDLSKGTPGYDDAINDIRANYEKGKDLAIFKSTHWEQPNILAHIRMNDRTDADGARVLFIEELQSDWGQAGKKKGFAGGDVDTERRALLQEANEATPYPTAERMKQIQARLAELAAGSKNPSTVPAAPFVTKTDGWLTLGLKRIIKMAVDEGYDKVAFVTGEQSAERYSLSKKISKLEWLDQGNDKGFLLAWDHSGSKVIERETTTDKVEDYVGKEVAKRLLGSEVVGTSPYYPYQKNTIRRLTGLELEVGGEGMKTFYNAIVPNAVKGLLKKLGGEGMTTVKIVRDMDPAVDVTPGQRSAEQPGFAITDKMRETAGDGLPMFSEDPKYAFDLNSIRAARVKPPVRAVNSWNPLKSRDETGRRTFGPGTKAYRTIADFFNGLLDWFNMTPISNELSGAIRGMRNDIDKARDLTADVAAQLSKLNPDERKVVSDYIEKELQAGVTPSAEIITIAKKITDIMGQQTDDLISLDMMSQDTGDRLRGKYLPRFYEGKGALKTEQDIFAKATKSMFSKPSALAGINGQSLRRRGITETVAAKDVPAKLADGFTFDDKSYDVKSGEATQMNRDYTRKERDDMKEVRDAALRFVLGYMRSQKDIALGRLYEHLAATIASKNPVDGFVEVPSTNADGTKMHRYGKLAGKWVPKEVLDQLGNASESEHEGVARLYRKALGLWKEGKVVLNPVSHVNNIISNISMAHFAGVTSPAKYVSAARDFATGGGLMKEAKASGLFGGTMTDAELRMILPKDMKALMAKISTTGESTTDRAMLVLSFGLRNVMGKAYQGEDLFFRYLIYKDARDRGLHENQAIDYAQKFIFTYDDLPKGARFVRDYGLPFFAYTYKVIPILAETALTHPLRMATPAVAIWAANTAAFAIAAGDDDDEWYTSLKKYLLNADLRKKANDQADEEQENLPDWLKGRSALGTRKTLRLWTDKTTGLPVFIDLSRLIPGGDLFDMQSNTGGVSWFQPLTISHPLFSMGVAYMGNRDLYFGNDISDKNDTTREKTEKYFKWTYGQVMPAIAPLNYHFNRVADAIANSTGEFSVLGYEWTGIGRDGLPVQAAYAAAQTFGLKVRPMDLDTGAQIAAGQTRALIDGIEKEIRAIRRLNGKGAISDSQAQRQEVAQKEKIDRLRDGLDVNGDKKP